ncbi:MAG TPA: glycosyl hydrolase family 28-related protein, partial [Verrucomicrobiae bacterium]|nr:glycosyl hydrolase family 28-related protein [Verrucomicrobiae bacterium]
ADDANAMFDHCTLVGRNGPAVSSTGNDWHSWMQFQHCTIFNALQLAGPGVFNVVDSTLVGSTQCVLSASATRAAFTGCTFSPAMNLVNQGNASNLLVDARQSISNSLPVVYWTNVANDSLLRKAARTNLYVVTDAPWGAYGNGLNDDTMAVQSALTAAGAAGGGIVYLPAGKYHLTNTLDVPSGVEFRGAFRMRHGTGSGPDGRAKGTVLQPYGGQGTTGGPPAIALEANSGLAGVTISYESQNTNCIRFPPAIQGRGGNVYIIGVCCPNPYSYVDLDTYTCTNHLLDMVDGWALKTGYKVGNGSSGTIVDCHCNWTYWIDNGDSQSTLPQSIQAPVLSFAAHYLQMYVLGDCTETMVKDFSIVENVFMNCVAEGGKGPAVTLINNYCDATIQGFVLDAAGPCTVSAVNTPMTTFNFGGYGDLSQATVAVLSTTNFQGTARFTSSVLWGGTWLDFNIAGGDVGFDMVHMDSHSFIGSIVNGGVFHLVNNSAYISYSGASNFPPYTVTFGPNAGLAGGTNEFIACYAYNGCGYVNASTNAPAQVWNDYALAQYSVLNPILPVVYAVYPNGSSLFTFTNTFSFSVSAPEGIATSNIVVTLDGVRLTNLVFTGTSTFWNVSYANLTLNAAHTALIAIIDNAGHAASISASFDTFSPNNYTFEAEDFDYTSNGVSGLFIDNPQTNAYAGLGSKDGIDCHNGSGGSASYRPNPDGLGTEPAGDDPRQAYAGALQDYDVGWNNGGNWGNYTRTFPLGVYHLYMRAASPNGSPVTADAASMSLVTSGLGTTNQTRSRMGTFTVPNTGGWHTFTWVPLQDTHGNPVQFTNSNGIKTLRVTTDNGGYNVNFYELVPVAESPAPTSLAISLGSANILVSFATQLGFAYQLEYKTNLTDSTWTALGGRISGDGSLQHLAEPLSGASSFYRLEIQLNQ